MTPTSLFYVFLLLAVDAPSVHSSDDQTLANKYLRQSSSSLSTTHRGLNLPEWFCSFFDGVASESDCEGNSTDTGNVTCPLVEPLSNGTGVFDLAQFTAHSWFVQKQQINGFQPSPDKLYCLVHTWVNRTEDDFFDYFPYGTVGSVDGPQQEWDVGLDGLPARFSTWCAGQDEYGGGLLRISPCILRTLLVRVGIPLWVIAVAADYSWVIISGGEPEDVRQLDPPLCTTRTNVSAEVLADTSGTGLWLMTRSQIASNETLEEMEQLLLDMGIYTGDLYPVEQEGCNYTDTILID